MNHVHIMLHPQVESRRRRSKAGFTVIELLVVVAIMVFMAGLTISRLDSRRSDVNGAVEALNGTLEQARWEARSKATYVWVCAKAMPEGGVQLAAYAARDGTSNSAAANLIPSVSPRLLARVRFLDSANATPSRLLGEYNGFSIDPADLKRLGNSTLAITVDARHAYAGTILCFNPRGEASIPGTDSFARIEIVILPSSGGAGNDLKASAVLVSTATGRVQICR